MFSNITPNPQRWKPNPDPSTINIPGLDKDASTIDQIEQIEQLITIKLQNIDENFSKIHNALANKLLPAVKRYSLGTEPVREAAKFWTSFYEQAAQIRIPTYEEFSTTNETQTETEAEEAPEDNTRDEHTVHDETIRETKEPFEPSIMTNETSFLPAQAAISSTPATARLGVQQSFASHASEDPSWTASMESPLVRLNREITQLSGHQDDSIISASPAGDLSEFTIQKDVRSFTSNKGKAKESSQPLLRNVLKHNLYTTSDTSSFDLSAANKVSPLKFKAKPKTPVIDRSRNPYLSDDTDPSQWTGLVDLRDPSAHTPQRIKPSRGKHTTPSRVDDDDDDSFDGLPPGMSPPVLMSPARPPRSSAELGLLKLGQTPMKEASSRIKRDLLKDAQTRGGHTYEASMSTLPTPPSLSRYRPQDEASTSSSVTKDTSLESMIRHIRRDIRSGVGSTPGLTNTPGLRIRPRAERPQAQSNIVQPVFSDETILPNSHNSTAPQYRDTHGHQQALDSDSDSDSMDEINTTAHPSAAFIMASQGAPIYDDSFGSNHSSDSMTDEDVDPGIVPIHPFAGNNAVEDDGFDDDDSSDGFEVAGAPLAVDTQEETLFGVAPVQRYGHGRASENGELRMLGEDLLQDTIGIGAQIAAHGRVEESPTPAAWGR
ncbi:hypothetical protein CVT24_005589 [Panaeolus cyanescens]|uniref:DASH complex subunit ASK1 n=1 Tax=Panaeolus cyanescens TaxID=181874 RepID=A0A409WTN5_9AGAR|nr:hypothetical protein CVT24_005589 [Panaeolus cyanescens]